MPYYGYGMFYDPTYMLVIIGAVICLIASARVRTTYAKYSRYPSVSGYTGDMIASEILRSNEMFGVEVRHVSGNLTDHFDPRNMTVNLSNSVYGNRSIAAIAVAAHECGHVLQHRDGYFPYKVRHALVPVANFGSSFAWILIIAGIFLGGYAANGSSYMLIQAGIYCFGAAVLFQIVTLPVEFNASRRALRILSSSGKFTEEELKHSRKVLSAAALTYVAGAAAAILQLLRLVLIFGGRSRD